MVLEIDAFGLQMNLLTIWQNTGVFHYVRQQPSGFMGLYFIHGNTVNVPCPLWNPTEVAIIKGNSEALLKQNSTTSLAHA